MNLFLVSLFFCRLFFSDEYCSSVISSSDENAANVNNNTIKDSDGSQLSLSISISLHQNDKTDGILNGNNFTDSNSEEPTLPLGTVRPIISRNNLEVSNFRATWINAYKYCYSSGGALVPIENLSADGTVRSALTSKKIVEPVWTSGQFQTVNGTGVFVWASSGKNFGYHNWDTLRNQPLIIQDSSTCVAASAKGFLETQYKWETASCDDELNFICVI